MPGGTIGKILFVDLTHETLRVKDLDEAQSASFIGGDGLGASLLYELMQPGVDPLGPENVLGFVTGPLTGSGAFFGGRYLVVCKSPVTGGWNDSNSGGRFGPELKKAGFDAVFISGAAPSPVYLWIKDGQAEIRPAGDLWGKDTSETLEALIQATGEKKLRAAVIGPAGEKLSWMAAIINEKHRAAGRGGAGAVMGSKMLKAVAVCGSGKIPVAHPEQLKAANRRIAETMKTGPMAGMLAAFGQLGTGLGTGGSALMGDMPVKNWGGVGLTDFGEAAAQKLDAAALDAAWRKRKYTCANCPLGCGADYAVEEGEWPLGETYRPEYETVGAFGGLLLNEDTQAILKCNEICNRCGLDTISTGGTVAWAIECFENGLLSREETGGLELRWGGAQAIVALTQAIADNTGLGRLLALGSAEAARRLGKGAEYLQTVRGIELPMHDPRIAPGYARTYQYDPTPGRHVKGGLGLSQTFNPDPAKYTYTGAGENDKAATCINSVSNAAGLCLFSTFTGEPDLIQLLMEAVTGQPFGLPEQLAAGARILNMRHAFNLREGLKPADFVLPGRSIGRPPLPGGPTGGITVDAQALGRGFFQAMGWDEASGRPSRESLVRLGGLEAVIDDLYGG